MATSPGDGDHRPWDLRLVEWMSRSSSTARSRSQARPLQLAIYTVFYWGIALANGGKVAYAIAAALTVFFVGTRVRARLIRRSQANG